METEQRNENAKNLHRKEIGEIIRLINTEDEKAIRAVSHAFREIEIVVKKFISSFRNDGTIYYCGAGTSGRLGFLDAAEIPPTYGVAEDRIVALLAGGKEALFSSKEGSEDSRLAGQKAIRAQSPDSEDLVVGITASGRTPYVLGCLEEATKRQVKTAAITNNAGAKVEQLSETTIVARTGPEVVAGSTRMKAGTAQKAILNMISTASMVRLGKVYDNLMIDVVASNEKLRERAENILRELTERKPSKIQNLLEETDYDVKLSLVVLKTGSEIEEAREALAKHNGHVEPAIKSIHTG